MSADRAAFMGRMTAGLSHDLVNVLATIQQASGLLEDYLALARKESLKTLGIRPQFRYHDKFSDILTQIRAQVDRGQTLCDDLNRLAHSPDEVAVWPDLDDACALLAGLCARQAKRAGTALTVEPCPERPRAAGASLVDVLAELGEALTLVLERCPGQGPVRLRAGADARCAWVELACPGLGPDQARELAAARAGASGCCLGVETVADGLRLRFARA